MLFYTEMHKYKFRIEVENIEPNGGGRLLLTYISFPTTYLGTHVTHSNMVSSVPILFKASDPNLTHPHVFHKQKEATRRV
jgi:hypothetical protein